MLYELSTHLILSNAFMVKKMSLEIFFQSTTPIKTKPLFSNLYSEKPNENIAYLSPC